MVVVALLSVDLVESVDLVSVVLVVNCTSSNWRDLRFLKSGGGTNIVSQQMKEEPLVNWYCLGDRVRVFGYDL